MSGWLPVVAGAGSAVAGGFYLAFSVVVMPALRRRPADEAITTMVRINELAVRPPFMVLFFGTAATCAAIAVAAAAVDSQTQPPLRVAGAAAYLAGWASTVVVNVPLNNRLSANGTAQPDQRWNSYERLWTRANHVRTALSFAGAAGLLTPLVP